MTTKEVTVKADIPVGWELACEKMRAPKLGEYYLANWGLDAGAVRCAQHDFTPLAIRVILRGAYVWQPWIKAKWMCMAEDGRWYLSDVEPVLNTWGWEIHGRWAVIYPDNSEIEFTPPECKDWRESKRRNPNR